VPRATRPSEIREALRDKGITMAAASIHFSLSQLQARGAVEQITDTKTVFPKSCQMDHPSSGNVD
jgi:hypothetical protein